MSGYNRRRRSKAAAHDDIGEGSNAAASSVTPDYGKIRGLSSDDILRVWRNKTGIQHLTLEQISDHQQRLSACFIALLDYSTLSKEQSRQLLAEAKAKSYEILCNGGTSENWPYPIQN